jgi:hypothetical protein
MRINMLSNLGSKRLLSFQAVLSEPASEPKKILDKNLKPDCGETRSGEWQKLMHFLN